jgi:hypothetical protein
MTGDCRSQPMTGAYKRYFCTPLLLFVAGIRWWVFG